MGIPERTGPLGLTFWPPAPAPYAGAPFRAYWLSVRVDGDGWCWSVLDSWTRRYAGEGRASTRQLAQLRAELATLAAALDLDSVAIRAAIAFGDWPAGGVA